MSLRPKGCRIEFVHRYVSGNNLSMTTEDIKTVVNWPTLKSSKDVERFSGLANYHRSFVKYFASLAQPLYNLTGKKKCGEPEQEAVEALKNVDQST